MKFGIILCEDGELWGGQVGFGETLIDRFQTNDDRDSEWIPIYAIDGILPTDEGMKTFDGFVITGSHYSVNDELQWIRRLEEFVKKIFQHNQSQIKKIKLFGICFGHQVIARTLGGTVGRNENKSFIFGGQTIQLSEDVVQRKFFRDTFDPLVESINIMQSHGEYVTNVPDEGVVVASSNNCYVEGIMYGDHVMSTQGHPELTKDLMVKNIVPRLRERLNWDDEKIAESVVSMETADTDQCVKMVCKFLQET